VLVPVRPSGEPVADEFGLVARRIVHHDMHVEAIGDVAFDLVEELTEFLRAVAWHAGADHGACLDLRLRRHRGYETRKVHRRAMTVVVRACASRSVRDASAVVVAFDLEPGFGSFRRRR
jgi:hypothetical protein